MTHELTKQLFSHAMSIFGRAAIHGQTIEERMC
jgi:hypothetical protein